MIALPKPPIEGSGPRRWQDWVETLWRAVYPQSQAGGDANADVDAATTYFGVSAALTAGRQYTLPSADAVPEGASIVFQDEVATAGAHTITIAARGTNTVNGAASVTIAANYGRKTLIRGRTRGTWFSA